MGFNPDDLKKFGRSVGKPSSTVIISPAERRRRLDAYMKKVKAAKEKADREFKERHKDDKPSKREESFSGVSRLKPITRHVKDRMKHLPEKVAEKLGKEAEKAGEKVIEAAGAAAGGAADVSLNILDEIKKALEKLFGIKFKDLLLYLGLGLLGVIIIPPLIINLISSVVGKAID